MFHPFLIIFLLFMCLFFNVFTIYLLCTVLNTFFLQYMNVHVFVMHICFNIAIAALGAVLDSERTTAMSAISGCQRMRTPTIAQIAGFVVSVVAITFSIVMIAECALMLFSLTTTIARRASTCPTVQSARKIYFLLAPLPTRCPVDMSFTGIAFANSPALTPAALYVKRQQKPTNKWLLPGLPWQ